MKTEQALASTRRRPNKVEAREMQTKRLKEDVQRRKKEKDAAEKMDHKQPEKETNTQRRDSWAGPLCGLRPPSLLLDSRAENTRGQHAQVIQLAESDPVALVRAIRRGHTPLGRSSCGLMDELPPP